MRTAGYIYIMTNKNKTTLYIGVTSNLFNRVQQHRNKFYPRSFSARYQLTYLVFYEQFSTIGEAIVREKQLKKWNRHKKELLIASTNPDWSDLWEKEVQFWQSRHSDSC
ncbi:MAG: GIY-YIG nuclease family protein [Bacteroidetes bacterium]|nr:GIY-YIG nuclease family protein [Bacteroidota bacterium]